MIGQQLDREPTVKDELKEVPVPASLAAVESVMAQDTSLPGLPETAPKPSLGGNTAILVVHLCVSIAWCTI
jgi:hypothetical protein